MIFCLTADRLHVSYQRELKVGKREFKFAESWPTDIQGSTLKIVQSGKKHSKHAPGKVFLNFISAFRYFPRKTVDYFRSNFSSIQTLILRFGYLCLNESKFISQVCIWLLISLPFNKFIGNRVTDLEWIVFLDRGLEMKKQYFDPYRLTNKHLTRRTWKCEKKGGKE